MRLPHRTTGWTQRWMRRSQRPTRGTAARNWAHGLYTGLSTRAAAMRPAKRRRNIVSRATTGTKRGLMLVGVAYLARVLLPVLWQRREQVKSSAAQAMAAAQPVLQKAGQRVRPGHANGVAGRSADEARTPHRV